MADKEFEFLWKTKGNINPKGKPRVYFTCHPQDFGQFFDAICEDLFSSHDCTVYYTEDMTAEIPAYYQDIDLGHMNLFVIPVTLRLLKQPNRAMDSDFRFAQEHHIPVLPIMEERGIDEDYSRPELFGDLQYLNPNSCDATEIGYTEKLKKYLNAVLISDETAERIRAAFDAYIFLSYRKKDRRLANKLMQLIHSKPNLQDIAIWYDEFLTPGESFKENIDHMLNDSRLFTLLVTKQLLEEPNGKPNYIMSDEYPKAKKRADDTGELPILPAEVKDDRTQEPVDKNALYNKFPGLPACVNTEDEAFLTVLVKMLYGTATRKVDDNPEHNYLIGLAYLGGIDVEKDPEKALRLITFAAENDLEEAIQKLVEMYESGEGVKRNYRTAIEWQKQLVQLYEKRVEDERNLCNCRNHINSLQILGDKIMSIGDVNTAETYYLLMNEKSTDYLSVDSCFESNIIKSLNKIGNVRESVGDLDGAETYYHRSLEQSEKISSRPNTPETKSVLVECLLGLGNVQIAHGDLKGAEKHYSRSLEIIKQISKETSSIEVRKRLISIYEKNAELHESIKPRYAESLYVTALDLSEELLMETNAVETRQYAAKILLRLGEINKSKQSFSIAADYYNRAYEIAEQIAEEVGTIDSFRNLSEILAKIGDAVTFCGEYTLAEEYYSQALEIMENVASETDMLYDKNMYAVCLSNMGYVKYFKKDEATSEELLLRSFSMIEAIAVDTGIVTACRDYAAVLKKIYEIKNAMKDYSGAEGFCLHALAVFKHLEMEYNLDEARHNIRNTLLKLGAIKKRQEDPDAEVEYYAKAVEVAEQQIEYCKGNRHVDDDSTRADNDFATILETLGNYYYKRDDMETAEKYYSKLLAVRGKIKLMCQLKKTIYGEGSRPSREIDVAHALFHYYSCLDRLGDIRKNKHDVDGAEEYYSRSIEAEEEHAKETNEKYDWKFLVFHIKELAYYLEDHNKKEAAIKWFHHAQILLEQLAEREKECSTYDDLVTLLINNARIQKPYDRILLKKAINVCKILLIQQYDVWAIRFVVVACFIFRFISVIQEIPFKLSRKKLQYELGQCE